MQHQGVHIPLGCMYWPELHNIIELNSITIIITDTKQQSTNVKWTKTNRKQKQQTQNLQNQQKQKTTNNDEAISKLKTMKQNTETTTVRES